MATYWGAGPLEHVKALRARKFFPQSFIDFANGVAQKFNERNEVTWGVDSSASSALTWATSHAPLSITAGHARLNGRMFTVGALTNEDMRSTGSPIFSDGTAVTGTLLTADNVYYCSMILTNSTGGGAISADGAELIPTMVVALGTGTGWASANATAYLTAEQVQAALDASTGIHDHADTRWAYICDVTATVNSAGSAISIAYVSNRNNAVQQH